MVYIPGAPRYLDWISAGCNTSSGSFTTLDQTLRVGSPLATGAVFCGDPAGVMNRGSSA